MCRTLPVFSLPLLALLSLPAGARGDLSRCHDKNRLLLVFAPSAADSRRARQDALLRGSRASFLDRSLLRFDLFERGRSRRAGTPLGRDEAVAPSVLTGRIDRMPMRRDEMRRDEMRRDEMRRRGEVEAQ